MSWSFQAIGKPEKIVQALEEESNRLTAQSKVEFDDAKPHLAALVLQNFAKGDASLMPAAIHLNASGSGTSRGDEQMQRSCTVEIKPLYTRLLT
jgi:hypothetical protein